eukprot:GDKI01024793.1.p2 GENE.GDKI01024793.1~~GDKI01024793.1.p2  ORF type:complete len:131 (-),score=26.00 GDKI01024793.1:21-413(-)
MSVLDRGAINSHFMSLALVRPWLDVHVYFDAKSPQDVARMQQLQRDLPAAFKGVNVYDAVHRPIGPHPLPMFEAHIKPEQAFDVMHWLHERNAVALVHPHTQDGGLADHTKNARWVGQVLEVVTDIFHGH